MAETTNPDSGVEQAAPSAESIESTLQSAFGGTPTKAQAPEKPETAESAPGPTDEVTPDDIPDEVEAKPQEPGTEVWEIVHGGQQVKLSRAEVIEHASKGFDYTQKTQALAERSKAVESQLARVAELEQLAPYVAQDLAQVKAIEAKLAEFSKVDWVALATNDPLEYPKWQAQFNQLREAYNAATYQFQVKASQLQQGKAQLTAERLQQEFPKLLERIPAWKDPAKYESGARELKSYLVAQGADPARVDQLSDSLEASIAYKAMQWDKLVAAKSEKVKQLRGAPPVVRPGAAASQTQQRSNADNALKEARSQGRKGNTRAQEGLLERVFEGTFRK